MSALKSQKQFLLLPLVAALFIGAYTLLQPSAPDIDPVGSDSTDALAIAKMLEERADVGLAALKHQHTSSHASCDAHGHSAREVVPVRFQSTTVPSLDGLFKHFEAKGSVAIDRATFDFTKGARKGDPVEFELDGHVIAGEVVALRAAEDARMSAVRLSNPEGRVVTSVDGNGDFSAYIVYQGDSRALRISEFDYTAQVDAGSIHLESVRVSDLFCGPKDMVYGGVSNASRHASTLLAADNTPGESADDVVVTPKLTNDASEEYVVYLDFDGASIVDDPTWGTVDALEHPRAKDSAWVTAVWERVVEDFAPFDLTITTDRSIYEDALETKRLQVIITPTDDANPGSGGGGVAGFLTFRTISPIVWVFNLEEYATADTISHEIGHAMGLSHDGLLSGDQYYAGHGNGVTSWAPIMGAAWSEVNSDGYYEFVTQWSRGEYTDADNPEDDIAILGNSRNGFGFREDDWADSRAPGVGDPALGAYVVDADGNVTANGVIGTSTDVDVFRIAANPGWINLLITPVDVLSTAGETGSDTPGANLALNVRLLDANGNERLVGTNEDALFAAIDYPSFGEVFYLEISGGARGTDATDGFSDYASVGYYSISGTVPPEPLAVSAPGGKIEPPVLNGTTTTSTDDGTDFGFTTPGRLVTSDFLLDNLTDENLTIVSVAFASGAEFEVVSAPTVIEPAGSFTLRLGYRPDGTGIASDTVIITYDSQLPESQTYEFALSGTATSSLGQDNYESNWSIDENSYNMTPHEDLYLSEHLGLAYQSDLSDWYKIVINDDDDFIQVDFSYDATGLSGPLQISLMNSRGQLVVPAAGTTGSESIGFVIPPEFTNLVYYIYVQRPAGDSVESQVLYDFKWSARPFTGVEGDDLYEDNNFQVDAFDLGLRYQGEIRLSKLLGPGIQFDDDWYKLTVPQDPYIRMLYVACEYDESLGDIAIDVSRRVDGFDQDLWTSDSGSGYEWMNYTEVMFVGDLIPGYVPPIGDDDDDDDFIIPWSPIGNTAVAGLEPGDYYIRVRGTDVGQLYDLFIDLARDDRYEVVGTEPSGEAIENDSEDHPFNLGDEIVGSSLGRIDGFGMLADYRSEPGDEIFVNTSDEDWYQFNFDRTDVEQVVINVSNLGVGSDYLGIEIRTTDGDLVASYKDKDASVLEYTLTIDNPTKSSYLVGLMPIDDIAYLTAYDFTVELNYDAKIVEGAVEDNYEENDDFEHPFNLKPYAGTSLIAVDGPGALFDPDWYEIEVPEGGTDLEILCTYVSDDANIELVLIRADDDLYGKNTLATFETESGASATVTWADPDPGLYRIGVIGDYVGTSYDLVWSLRRTEDNYEPNEDADNPFDLRTHERRFLHKLDGLGVQANEDWYRVAARADTEQLIVDLYFSHAEGDIELELYTVGGVRLDRSVTGDDNERIVYDNPAEGDYLVRIYPYEDQNTGSEYDLAWAALDVDEVNLLNGQDAYEENDSLEAAYPLTAENPRLSDYLGLGTQADDDFYSIPIEEGNVELYVECLFTDAVNDIDLELYDPSGMLVARRDGVADNEIIDLKRPLIAGTYYLRVYGTSFGSEYDLYWLAKTEDIYEDNDYKNDAYDITSSAGQPLSEVGVPTQGDADWFAINATGSSPYIQVTLDYVHVNGSIDFQVRDATGNTILVTADSTDDSETVFIPVDAGINYIYVYGDNAYNPYDLTWELFNDDIYEENNTSAAAKEIPPSISAVQFDEDWYWFDATTSNAFLSVVVNFTHAAGNIDLAVYEEVSPGQLNLIGTSATDEDVEAVSLPGGSGTYYIQVTGDNVNPEYQLTWGVSEDDDYEENDTPGAAADITGNAGVALAAIQFDTDWFRVYAPPGNVKLTVDLGFKADDGNLNVSLYPEGSDGTEAPLASVDSDTDNESLVYPLDPYAPDGVTFLVKVDGTGAGTNYTILWEASNEDNFEGEGGNNGINDASDDLLDTEGQRISGTIGYAGALDDDWYQVRINSGDEGIVIEALFVHTDTTNIDLELFNASGSRVARSIGFSDVERIHYKGGAGDYFLRVFGSSGENPYDLIWNSYKEDNLEKGVEGATKVVAGTPDNDSPDTPRGLQATEHNGVVGYPGTGGGWPDLEFFILEDLTQLDEEWYSVEVEPGEDVFIVDLQFEHASGDIDVVLYRREIRDSDDNILVPAELIARADSDTDGEQIRIPDPNDPASTPLEPGDYLIGVYGYGIKNPKLDLDPAWTFDPYTDDYDGGLVENADLSSAYYDGLAEGNARGLASTYSLQWVSATEDDYDIPTVDENDVEVNDSLAKAIPPDLIDQNGIEDPVVLDELRSMTEQNDEGEDQTIEYRPIYTIPNLAQFDEDWFAVTVDTGGVHDFYASILFNALHGNLDLYVYDINGNLLDSSTSETSYAEYVDVNGNGEVTYFLQVVGNNLGVPYDLNLRGFFDDSYEENDTIAEADVNADLSDWHGLVTGNIFVKRDVDLYRIEVPEHQVHLYFWLRSGVNQGIAFNLEVLDEFGNPLPAGFEQSGGSTETNDNYSAGVIAPEAGTYYLSVSGEGGSGLSYGIAWDYDNVDEYDDTYPGWLNWDLDDNNTALNATDLTRFRLEPIYDPKAPGPLDPIQEFGFDYGLLSGLTMEAPSFDPFGHAIQEADDWYAIQIPSWTLASAKQGNKTIQVLKRLYYARLSAEIEFTHDEGDINIEIYDDRAIDVDGSVIGLPLAKSATEEDIESVFAAIDPMQEARIYYIRVYGDNHANDYTLKWDVTRDDAYEELEDDAVENDTNNFLEIAYNLTRVGVTDTDPGTSTEGQWLHELMYPQDTNGDGMTDLTAPNGYGIQTSSDDWYAVVVSDGATEITVDCAFYSDNDTNYEYKPDDLDIDFEVYFVAGNDGDDTTYDQRKPVLIGRSTEDTDDTAFIGDGSNAEQLAADITIEITESATFAVDQAGIYLIRIYYDDKSHPYTFTWDDDVDDDAGDQPFVDDYLKLGVEWGYTPQEELPAGMLNTPNANDDGDALPNWAEFALALDPTAPDYAVVGQSIVEIDGKNYYQFEFLRTKEAVAYGYEFIVEETETMVFDGTLAVFVGTEVVTPEIERVFYRCSNSMDVQDKCFFRLTVKEPVAKE